MSILFAAEQASFDISPIINHVGNAIYLLLALVAFWGAYSLVVIWRRAGQLRFKDEEEQSLYLEGIEELLQSGKAEEIESLCEDDPRAVAQLTLLAYRNRHLPTNRLRDLLTERFQRDVSADLEYRGSWVQTVIKSAPMLGLFGTVIGMMGAFGKLSSSSQVSPDKLAADISLALVTTACGLAIAVPLILATASINIRIGKMEDLVGSGMNRLLEIFRS